MKGRNQKGQALIETALVLPVFLAMVLGIFGFGRIFNAQLVITNACREGARVGALGRSDLKIKEAVDRYLAGASLTDPATQVVIERTTGTDGTDLKVDISYPFRSSVTLPGIPDPIFLKTSAVMRVEQ